MTGVRMNVADYLALDAARAFAGKTELIEGQVVRKDVQHRPHASIKSRLALLLSRVLPDHLEAIVEGSIDVPPHNVPEPDIVVTSEADGSGLIPLASVRLVVEVADATLRSDLTRKAAIYARHGVPEYWVVDVNGALVHRLWSPREDAFAMRDEVRFGEPLTAATIDGVMLDTIRL